VEAIHGGRYLYLPSIGSSSSCLVGRAAVPPSLAGAVIRQLALRIAAAIVLVSPVAADFACNFSTGSDSPRALYQIMR